MTEGSMGLRAHMRHVRDVYFTDVNSAIGFVYFSIMGAMGLFMLLAIPIIPVSKAASGGTVLIVDVLTLILDIVAGLMACLGFLAYTGARERAWRYEHDADYENLEDDTEDGMHLRESLINVGVPVRDARES